MLRRFTASPVLAAAAVVGIAIGATAGSVAAGTAHKVSMSGSKYTPAEVKARVGDTIRFDNDDFENHWVYVPTAGNYQVSRAGLKPGESFEITAREPGKFTVLCGLHTSMETVVTVAK
jgi:plastocyanin